jgi:D-beta-D-heptose 7-phosphate kinase/D-beta-D-heptose 1-phosphate adenosyltransferase
MRLDDEEAGPPSGPTQDRLVDALRRLFGEADAVIVSDYGRGTVTDRVVDELALLQRRSHRVLVVDAHDITRFTAVGATAVKPNYSEARVLLHGPSAEADRAQRVVADAGRLLSASGADVVAVTLDQDGAVVCERGQPPYRTWTRPARSVTACGAGDSYTAALACALAAGLPTPTAADLAQGAAELVAALDGTSVCTAEDLRLHLAVGTAVVMPPEDLAPIVSLHQRQGRRVVFTNGCFDLLHRGHVDLLRRAKRLGDVLVVGLNSDRSVAALKGPGRPVNALEDRAGVLAALGCVDHITAFDDPVASGVIDLLRPDVYVKGGDYTPAMLPEAAHVEAYGGAVQIMPYVQDRSTSSIIARIRS